MKQNKIKHLNNKTLKSRGSLLIKVMWRQHPTFNDRGDVFRTLWYNYDGDILK